MSLAGGNFFNSCRMEIPYALGFLKRPWVMMVSRKPKDSTVSTVELVLMVQVSEACVPSFTCSLLSYRKSVESGTLSLFCCKARRMV